MDAHIKRLIYKGYEFEVRFWRKSQGPAREGMHIGETTYGYSSYADAMRNVYVAANCMDADSVHNDLTVHLTMDGFWLGDFPIEDCY